MKLVFLFLSIFTLFSCKDECTQKDILNKSETLLRTDPDSAYALLNSIPNPAQMSDKQQARWCMLVGESADKIYEDMPSSNLVVQAQTWYKKHGTAEEQARISLFLGRSYIENKEFEKAMTIYMEALEAASTNRVYNQAGYLSSYIADLYLFKDMPGEARKKNIEGADYFLKAGNKRSYALALRDIAYTWATVDSVNKALWYMTKADTIVSELNDRKAMASIANGLGNLYEMKGDYQKAEENYLQSLDVNNKNNKSTYLALSSMYTQSGNLEKAGFYLEKAKIHMKEANVSAGIIYQQYLLAKASNHIEDALNYLEQYDAACDSVTSMQNESDILKIEKKYQQEKILKENSQLHIAKQRNFILVILLIIICLVISYIFQIKLRKQRKKIYEQQITLDNNKLVVNKLNNKLEQVKDELSLAKKHLNKTNEQIEQQNKLEEQQKLYEQQKTELEQINNEIMQVRKEKLFASSIAKKIIKLSKSVKAGTNTSPLTAKDWSIIQAQIDEIYISLPQLLKNEILSFTPADIECCYLSFFDLDPQAEAILLNINPDSASRRRSRLRKKLDIIGEDKSLHEFLTKL